jgi:hypothetical protein
LHQNQSKRLLKLTGDIFNTSKGDKARLSGALKQPQGYQNGKVLRELLLHQDQSERLAKLTSDIFDTPAGDKAVFVV